MADQNEWNFIFLIYADLRTDAKDPNSDSAKFALLNPILQSLPIQAKCNLFVIKNLVTIVNADNKIIVEDRFVCEQYNQGVGKGIYGERTVMRMDDKEIVIGAYLKKISDDFPAEKSALFTWDHGNIIGINKVVKTDVKRDFESEIGEIDVLPEYEAHINPLLFRTINGIDKDKFLEGLLRSVKDPSPILSRLIGEPMQRIKDVADTLQLEADMLTNEMLARALKNGGFSEKRKIDVVCMMNCCMQNLHTQYALKDVAHYLVAPQTWIYFPGYDYKEIFTQIFLLPAVSGRNLASMIIDTCRKDTARNRPLVPKSIYEALYAVDLNCIDEIFRLLKTIIDHDLIKVENDPALKRMLKTLLFERFTRYDEYHTLGYRPLDLFEVYKQRTVRYYPKIKPFINACCDKLFWEFARSVVGKFVGKDLAAKTFLPAGICMSLPDSETYKNPKNIFILLYYNEQSPHFSHLIRDLKVHKLLDILYKD